MTFPQRKETKMFHHETTNWALTQSRNWQSFVSANHCQSKAGKSYPGWSVQSHPAGLEKNNRPGIFYQEPYFLHYAGYIIVQSEQAEGWFPSYLMMDSKYCNKSQQSYFVWRCNGVQCSGRTRIGQPGPSKMDGTCSAANVGGKQRGKVIRPCLFETLLQLVSVREQGEQTRDIHVHLWRSQL